MKRRGSIVIVSSLAAVAAGPNVVLTRRFVTGALLMADGGAHVVDVPTIALSELMLAGG